MRIIELGLKAFAKTLSVSTDTNRSWDAILKKLTEAVKSKHPHEDRYHETIARLYVVKDAWRNPTMHVERRYNDEEALDIFNSVSSFMRHLASFLSEQENG